jgi:hypothetical protein
MANFNQWAAPSSSTKANSALYESGGFDDAPPPSKPEKGGSSYISSALKGPSINLRCASARFRN